MNFIKPNIIKTPFLPTHSIVLPLLLLFSMASILQRQAQASTVYNYGEDVTALNNAYASGDVHFLQIGDSHTAGDYFTEQLRKRLQAEVGDGGVGFAYPAKLKGQRSARHGYSSSWSTKNSRSNRGGGDYPLGGVYASPSNRASTLKLTSQYYAGDTQNADIVVYGNVGQTLTLSNRNGTRDVSLPSSGWQTVKSPITFPTDIQADTNIKVGGFWLNKANGGGVVSAMGINGATQDYWNRWNSDLARGVSFSKADLVILAYGTNEAFRGKYSNVVTLKNDMNKAVRNIRQGLPNANILIVGAPESLKSTSGSCGKRANYLDTVQSQLQQVAEENHTLYWSWQEAMGGSCSMKSWVSRGLAAKDGVHFSRSGYNKAANDLYGNLKNILAQPNTSLSYQSEPNTYTNNGNYADNDSYTNDNINNNPNMSGNNSGQSYNQSNNQSVNQPNNSYSNESYNSGLTNIEIKRTYIETPNQNVPNNMPNMPSNTGYQYDVTQPTQPPVLKICSASTGCVQ